MHYFDHSATTPLHPRVKQLMDEVGKNHFGNPSSIHRVGRKARAFLEAKSQRPLDAVRMRLFLQEEVQKRITSYSGI